jgi:hypothetical protein
MTLRRIPLIDLDEAPLPALTERAGERLEEIMAAARHHYGGHALRLGDNASRRWLTRNGNPYLEEIWQVARRIGQPGAFLLNLSYEWTCTTGVGPDPEGGGRMLRTLDWPLDNLGRAVVVARRRAAAGEYYAPTWPGFVGLATAMAPGRFAAALNQPPMRRWSPSCWADWALARVRVWRSRGLPPTHLLRRVFDTCRTYAEAREALARTPLSLPAFFILCGLKGREGCVIERLENDVRVHEGPASCANHWLGFRLGGAARGHDSEARLAQMAVGRDRAGNDFGWVKPPILNPTTRLAVVANPARGTLLVRGWEANGPATEVFRL